MRSWIIDNSWLIALLVSVIFYAMIRIRRVGYRQVLTELRELAFGLMLLAEKQYGRGNGHLKMEWVIDQVYIALPDVVKYFIPEDQIPAILQNIYDELKDFMEDGRLN